MACSDYETYGALVCVGCFSIVSFWLVAHYICRFRPANISFYTPVFLFYPCLPPAMYLIFAISIIFIFFPVWFKEHKSIRNYPLSFGLFILCVFLCSSKFGHYQFADYYSPLILRRFSAHLNFRNLAVGIASLCLILFVSYKIAPTPFQRLGAAFSVSYYNIDKTSSRKHNG